MINTRAEYDHVVREVTRHACESQPVEVTLDAGAPRVLVIYASGLLLVRDDAYLPGRWTSIYRHHLFDDCPAPFLPTTAEGSAAAVQDPSSYPRSPSPARVVRSSAPQPSPPNADAQRPRRGHVPALSQDISAYVEMLAHSPSTSRPLTPVHEASPSESDSPASGDASGLGPVQASAQARRGTGLNLVDVETGKRPTWRTTQTTTYRAWYRQHLVDVETGKPPTKAHATVVPYHSYYQSVLRPAANARALARRTFQPVAPSPTPCSQTCSQNAAPVSEPTTPQPSAVVLRRSSRQQALKLQHKQVARCMTPTPPLPS